MKRVKMLARLPDNAVFDQMNSPVGELTLIVSPLGLHSILWDLDRAGDECQEALLRFKRSATNKLIVTVKKQLTEYFQGKRKAFDIPLAIDGTPFQRQAWQQLQKIPYGKTISYGEQAARVGDKKKARAVGMANGLNPISIIIPCHRVIGSNGKLTGFAGGLDKKAFLLQLETDNL